ncbi:hypothetical protein POM88_050398 [Heracleum sosnowskyi]|uniref:Uncharacterized protein n=1 Tax=Heracleum sosnowskyi TaxID=360622 RepID=A0AAD8GXI2_9APIA|nr:hypothetical protein POM88_050398 [Heracleum sosnowskyi]
MNKSYLGQAITSCHVLDVERLEKFWLFAELVGDIDGGSITFKVGDIFHSLTAKTINEALGITLSEGEHFQNLPSDETLTKFFFKIGYSGPCLEEGSVKWFPTGEMDSKYLRKEWSMLIDAMVRIFSAKSSGWNGIPYYIKRITHSLDYRYKVDIGKLLNTQFKAALGKSSSRKKECLVLKKNTHCTEHTESQQIFSVMFHKAYGSLDYLKAQRIAITKSRKRPLEAGVSGGIEGKEGDTASNAANKEVSENEPTVTPHEPKKKRVKWAKVTVSHPTVPQKIIEDERELNTSLYASSQQETSIETGMSPKAPCNESAPPHEEPPLAETHSEREHGEESSFNFDASLFTFEEQPNLNSLLSTSSFPTTSIVSSPQPREGERPNLSGFDHSSSIMDEPPSSGPQEPIVKSSMDTTPPNTEKGHTATLLEIETTSSTLDLQKATYQEEVAVTASVVVNDTPKVVVTQHLDSNLLDAKVTITSEVTVTSTVPPLESTTHNQLPEEVLLEDVSSEDDIPLSALIKVHSKPSNSVHISTAHTYALRMSEGEKKKREIKEKRGEQKHERQPNEMAKGEGLEHVQRETEGAHTKQALGLERSFVRNDEIIRKNNESVRTPLASLPYFSHFPVSRKRKRSSGPSNSYRSDTVTLEAKGESKEIDEHNEEEFQEEPSHADKLKSCNIGKKWLEHELDGETVLVSEEVLKEIKRLNPTQGKKPIAKEKKSITILPGISIREPVNFGSTEGLQSLIQREELENAKGKGNEKVHEQTTENSLIWTDGKGYTLEEADLIMPPHLESTMCCPVKNDYRRGVEYNRTE